jgi:hypothetical protein
MNPRDETTITQRQWRLLADDVAQHLKLTSTQMREIGRVLEPHGTAASAGSDPWELARQNEARILQILTAKQISQWRAMERP